MFKGRRGVTMGLLAIMAIPMIGLVGGGYWLYDDLAVTASKLEEFKSAAVSEGVPLEDTDLQLPAVKADQDALKELKAIEAAWTSLSPSEQRQVQLSYRSKAQGQAETDGFASDMAVGQKLFSLARAAAAKIDASLTRDWSKTSEYSDLHMAVTQTARLLCNEAVSKGLAGKFDSAYQDLGTVRLLGRHLSRRSAFYGMQAHLAVENLALSSAEEILVAGMNSADCRAQYGKFVSEYKTAPDVLANLEAESVHANSVFGDPKSFDGGSYAGVKLKIEGDVL